MNLVFNIMDTVGRYLAGKKILSCNTTITLALVRTIFFVTTLLTALHSDPGVIFRADWFRLLNLFLFSLSNGYISTMCIIIAPTLVKEK